MKNSLVLTSVCIICSGCLFDEIIQPNSVSSNQEITVRLTIIDNIPETTNPHKGILAAIIPEDWDFISASFIENGKQGSIVFSHEWTDSINTCYPPSDFGESMKWICLISDTGYTYDNDITITVELNLLTGSETGCFQLGYLVTKATPNLICSGNMVWAPISFPHAISVGGAEDCDFSQTREAPEWSSLFQRYEGWSGADGIYSIPLNGSEIQSNKTLIVFSDTFIGAVDSITNERISPTNMVNNTYAILNGDEAIEDSIDFFFYLDQNNNPISIFEPQTQSAESGDWYWLMDGVSVENIVYLYALRMDNDVPPFSIDGVVLITFQVDHNGNLVDVEQSDTPLFYEYDNGDHVVYGQAIMPLTNSSGVMAPDGYIYFYGSYNDSPLNTKRMTVARTTENSLLSYDEWEFWNGTLWVNDISQAEIITDNISPEFSVTQLDNNRYIAVFQQGGVGNYVAYRISNNVNGPFSTFYIIWDAPEYNEFDDVSAYNAKAHPHLSDPDHLLISYNVNTNIGGDFWYHFERGDLYRPRFISLPLNNIYMLSNVNEKISCNIPESVGFTCFPNPFNNHINILIQNKSNISSSISIYNINGKKIRSEFLPPFVNSYIWNGLNNNGKPASSGTYIVRIDNPDHSFNNKILLMK
ncbi:MAG: hypothetical protein CMG74_12120 [Candidatus Marinimicrobia bacterium]|nr:hypothetical protein [Candidatus Neomarinimicrobiota bacterium]|tara:strand:- start:9690 stop:11615 length:1926 start_codon:yes stop_codon:yes gene_type:complete